MPCIKNEVVERLCAEFEEQLRLAEKLVHTHFVLEAASKDNVDVNKLALDPVMLHRKGTCEQRSVSGFWLQQL